MKRLITALAASVLTLTAMGTASAVVNDVTPSTNDINRDKGWAHFDVAELVTVGKAEITFNQPRNFMACFEYRIDGAEPTGEPNPNTRVTDGLWPHYCLDNRSNGTQTATLTAMDQIEIRMVFGAETDERFDWTAVEVLPPTKADCMDGGWEDLGFNNQGQCIATIN